MIGMNGIAFMSASRWNIVSLRRSTPERVLAGAIWFPTLIAIALAIVSYWLRLPLWAVLIAQFGFFLAIGRANPNVAALALAPHARAAGTASALMGAVQSGLGVLAGVAVAMFSDGTLSRLATLMAGFAVSSLLCYLLAKGAEAAG
jgi:DHA1 family bicyclomycin/chloramphenicol resistance-like MFS transporter